MSEWRYLPTLADVAAAQAAGDEIEVGSDDTGWCRWNQQHWFMSNKYRARAKPKVRKIRILGWVGSCGETLTRREDLEVNPALRWIRYPKLDDEVEVPL